MIVPYAVGKYLNTDLIELIDTTVNPPTVTIGGQVIPIPAPFVARIRAAIESDNAPPPAPPPAAPQGKPPGN